MDGDGAPGVEGEATASVIAASKPRAVLIPGSVATVVAVAWKARGSTRPSVAQTSTSRRVVNPAQSDCHRGEDAMSASATPPSAVTNAPCRITGTEGVSAVTCGARTGFTGLEYGST